MVVSEADAETAGISTISLSQEIAHLVALDRLKSKLRET